MSDKRNISRVQKKAIVQSRRFSKQIKETQIAKMHTAIKHDARKGRVFI